MMQLDGEWENQNGSVLRIGTVVDGAFTGTFVSAKGRAARDRHYPVHGVVNGDLVAFVVDFNDAEANLHAISSFSGRLQGDVLHTVWVLARAFEDAEFSKPTQPWNSFLVNSDRFVRISD